MSYTKTVWVNDHEPSINAANLNKMEQGIYDAQYPDGGDEGQLLTKTQNGAEWQDFEALPGGGTSGQVLTRTSSGADWEDIKALPDGGTAGQILYKTQSAEAWQNFPRVECTQAEYDAMSSHDPNVVYYITDGSTSYPTAEEMRFDPTGTGLSATSVQGAIEELNTVEDISSAFVPTENVSSILTKNIKKIGKLVVGSIVFLPADIANIQNHGFFTLSDYRPNAGVVVSCFIIKDRTSASSVTEPTILSIDIAGLRAPNRGGFANVGAVTINSEFQISFVYTL